MVIKNEIERKLCFYVQHCVQFVCEIRVKLLMKVFLKKAASKVEELPDHPTD